MARRSRKAAELVLAATVCATRAIVPMILYHFTTSPFARRVRLVLAHKGLVAELRDARAEPAHMNEVRRLNPLHTVPVLVDGERVLADSTTICEYLDRKAPTPPLWPSGLAGADASELVVMTGNVINILTDAGMRYCTVHGHPSFEAIRVHMIGRVQRTLDFIAEKVAARGNGVPLCGDGWSFADIALFTTVAWLETLPVRGTTFPPAKLVADLGWSLPDLLRAWADQHRQREDVLGLG